MKTQVVVIHGGDAFEKYEDYLTFLKGRELTLEKILHKDWKSSLQDKLGDNFQVIAPQMPSKYNARYVEWKIWLDKIIPLLDNNVVFVGHSMGGIFLAQYLSETKVDQKILGTFLIAPPFDTADAPYELCDFALPTSLVSFGKQDAPVFLYSSKDDPVVPFVDLSKYEKALPTAKSKVFENRGHFIQSELSELVEDIKSLVK